MIKEYGENLVKNSKPSYEQLTVTNFMLNVYDYVVRKARVFREVDGQEVVRH